MELGAGEAKGGGGGGRRQRKTEELGKEKGETARDSAKWAMPSKGSIERDIERERHK